MFSIRAHQTFMTRVSASCDDNWLANTSRRGTTNGLSAACLLQEYGGMRSAVLGDIQLAMRPSLFFQKSIRLHLSLKGGRQERNWALPAIAVRVKCLLANSFINSSGLSKMSSRCLELLSWSSGAGLLKLLAPSALGRLVAWLEKASANKESRVPFSDSPIGSKTGSRELDTWMPSVEGAVVQGKIVDVGQLHVGA